MIRFQVMKLDFISEEIEHSMVHITIDYVLFLYSLFPNALDIWFIARFKLDLYHFRIVQLMKRSTV